MSEIVNCPQCGSALPDNAPAGLCPRCVMALNFQTQTLFTDEPVAFGAMPPPPSPAELAPHFPQLEILECLGRGGMGVVYKARQPQLDRLVALKILAPERVTDARFAERFLREARALAKLNHPNIVTIHDFGQAGQYFYLLMEYVDGVNLRDLMRRERISPREALSIVPVICQALQYAHDRGIIHRDIKPENILLDKEGRVKIADFGIARMLQEPAEKETASVDAPSGGNLTGAGVIGTPKYMAPEQAEKSGEADHRADIYSLGVVFYEMLTGELPGKNLEPPSKKVHIDVRLDEIVLRALEKKPDRRYQQASVFQTQVETVAATTEGEKLRRPPPTTASPWHWRIGLACDILAALGLITLGWGAKELGIFFNALYVLILICAPWRAVLTVIAWSLQSREFGLFRHPFAPELRKHLWQALNRSLFWILALVTVEICVVPAQFSPQQFQLVQFLTVGGAAVLLLLEWLPGKVIFPVTNLAMAIASIFILFQAAKIYWLASKNDGVVLAAPFRGDWLVLNGGNSSLINIHYSYDNQQFALDIEHLVGGREKTAGTKFPESYFSWGQPIYAPADGKVTEVENDMDDNLQRGQSDEDSPAGNHVVIDIGGGHYVMMAHFRKGSVQVHVGESVRVGQAIATAGNSGNTSQPHLHIQVQDSPKFSDSPTKTFPILFRDVTCQHGKRVRTDTPFLVRRNDLITGSSTLDLVTESHSIPNHSTGGINNWSSGTSRAGRQVKASGDITLGVKVDGNTFTVGLGGPRIEANGKVITDHTLIVENQRLLLDGEERARIPESAKVIDVICTNQKISVTADQKTVFAAALNK